MMINTFKNHLLLLILCLLTGFATAQEDETRAKISTDFGDIIVKLYDDTPKHKENFIKYATNGWYDGTIFHRVVPFFMAQGGDPNSVDAKIDQSLGADRCPLIDAEINPKYFHKKGALAAARMPDGVNPEKQSSGCQFFLVQGYKQNDAQLKGQETDKRKFTDMQKAWYKVRGGSPFLDGDYTIFGEIIEGIEVLDLIMAMPTGEHVADRPNTDIKMTVTILE